MKIIFYSQWALSEPILDILAFSFGHNYRAISITITLIGVCFGLRLTKDFPKWDI